MRRLLRSVLILTACLTAGFAAGLALSAAASAVVLPLPVCSVNDPGVATNLASATNQPNPPFPPHCWYVASNPAGEAAGYLAANDNHTHYRFVTTNFKITPQTVNLNGDPTVTDPTGQQGAEGVLECDPNNHSGGNGGYVAEFGVLWDTGLPTPVPVPFYSQGFYPPTVTDPCVTHTLLVPHVTSNPVPPAGFRYCPPGGAGNVLGNTPATVFCGSFPPAAINDQLAEFAIYYTPAGFFFHRMSFGYCDVTAGSCHQAYSPTTISLNWWEIGAGVFSGVQFLGSPPDNQLIQFTSTGMNCYSCAPGPRPISVIQPVNSTGVGGLEQVMDVNASNTAVLGPGSSLDGAGDFTMFNGSTS